MAELEAVTDDTFESSVLNADGPVLVDFWATWCGPCRQVAPILEEIAAEYEGRLKVVKLDADANPVTPAKYKVVGLPTINLYQNGELVRSLTGAKPKTVIVNEISSFIS